MDVGPAADDRSKPSAPLGLRHLQALMLFLAFVLCFGMTVNMGVAIVVMTDPGHTNSFDWNIRVQSVMLSSFFWGYLFLQIPAGELANKFGGKSLILLCVGTNAAASLVLPLCAYYGFLMPVAHNLLAKWAPLEEKSRMSGFVYVGAQLGTALQFLSAGLVADLWGWPFIFYINGILGAAWSIAYAFLGASSPEDSKLITEQEKIYIQKSLGHVGGHQKLKTPWRSIATSFPFLSVVVAHCGFKWGYWTLVTEIPTYLHRVFGMDIKANGMLSALPYLAIFLLSFPFSFMSDAIINRKWLTVTASRKLFNSIGHFGPALVLVGLAHVAAHQVTAAVLLLTLAVGINAAIYSGNVLSSLDMAPNFAGTLMGISNTFASTMAVIAPLVIGVILKDEGGAGAGAWRPVFYLAGAVYLLTNLLYLAVGSCERQRWNEPPTAAPPHPQQLG